MSHLYTKINVKFVLMVSLQYYSVLSDIGQNRVCIQLEAVSYVLSTGDNSFWQSPPSKLKCVVQEVNFGWCYSV